MGRKATKKKPVLTEAILPTPERMAKDIAEDVNPALIDSKQTPGTVTRLTQSPVDRWFKSGMLSDKHMIAINHCENLWKAVGTQRLTQDFTAIRCASGGDGLSQHNALIQLGKYKDDAGFEYWNVFENVVRQGEPGGTAGSSYANDNGRASMAALMIVRFVSDRICKMNGFKHEG